MSPFEDTHYGTREMVVRDPDKAVDARDAVVAAVPGADVVLDACDVSSITVASADGPASAGMASGTMSGSPPRVSPP